MVEMVEMRKMVEVAVLVDEDLLESKNPLEWQGCPAVFEWLSALLSFCTTVIRMVMVKVEDDDDQVRDGRRRRPGSREHTRHSDDQRSQQDIGKSPSYEKIHSIFTVSVFV